jgi:putative methyltransferase (TIGR04325 family)
MTILKKIFKNLISIILQRKIYFKGNFSSFDLALQNSRGYYDSIIIKKKIEAFEKFLNDSKIEYERDGVLFYKKNYDQTLCSIIKKLSLSKKKLNVLDYGGSFASLYFKNFKRINKYNVNWIVLEQKKIVKYFNKNLKYKFSNIFFFEKLPKLKFDIIIFGSSLQYLKSPFLKLNDVLKFKSKYILLLKTPFDKNLTKKVSVIKIQYVPKNIYKSSYPIHILNKKFLINFLNSKNYKEIKIKSNYLVIDNILHEDLLFVKN